MKSTASCCAVDVSRAGVQANTALAGELEGLEGIEETYTINQQMEVAFMMKHPCQRRTPRKKDAVSLSLQRVRMLWQDSIEETANTARKCRARVPGCATTTIGSQDLPPSTMIGSKKDCEAAEASYDIPEMGLAWMGGSSLILRGSDFCDGYKRRPPNAPTR